MKENLSYKIFNEKKTSNYILICDHATNLIDNKISKNFLNLSKKDLERHIAYDIGALELSKLLSNNLNCLLIHTIYSRLLIDPNRDPKDPTSIMKFYDKTIIKGNISLKEKDKEFRKKKLYSPYHKKISELLIKNKNKNNGNFPKIISIHTFSKELSDNEERPWDIGVLWFKKNNFSKQLINNLKKNKKLTIGENEPYDGKLPGSTLDKQCSKLKIEHALLEVRNDHLTSKDKVCKWAELITQNIKDIEKIEKN